MGTTRVKVIDLSSAEKEKKSVKKQPVNAVPDIRENAALSANSQTETKFDTKNPPEEVINNPEQKVEPVKKPKIRTSKTKTKTSQKNGAKYQAVKKVVEDKKYPLTEALELLPQTSYTKFDPTVEIHLNVTEKNIKRSVDMPFLKTEKKEVKYLVFADKNASIKNQSIIWADEKTIDQIEKGALKTGKDFDIVVADPKFMPTLAKVAKILGPKGLMPNPKNGTITDNIEKYLENTQSATGIVIRCDPTAPIIHTKIGKLSQKESELSANLKALILSIGLSKIQKATLTTTMGPAIRLDTTTLK
jgi:large subunit ribosomal protein L1